MPTSGIIRGRDYVFHWNAVQITHLTSAEMTLGMETIDVTTADSSDWVDLLKGDKSWNFQITFLTAFDAVGEGIDEMTADWDNQASGTALLTTGVTGDTTFTGTAFITNFSVSNTREGVSTCSVSIQGTDALTIGTV